MPDGMIVLDTSNQIVDLNPASAAIFRLTPKQMIGQKINQFFPISTDLDKYLQLETSSQMEFDFGTVNPGHIFELRLSVLQDQFNQIVGKSLVLRDITKRKKMKRNAKD